MSLLPSLCYWCTCRSYWCHWLIWEFGLLSIQEIKFEPSVMCERLDRKASFRFSQVFVLSVFLARLLKTFIFSDLDLLFWFISYRLKMGILYAFRRKLLLKLKNESDFQMFLHIWNMSKTVRWIPMVFYGGAGKITFRTTLVFCLDELLHCCHWMWNIFFTYCLCTVTWLVIVAHFLRRHHVKKKINYLN